MLQFPISTEFNKRIPKQKFYDRIRLSPDIERQFIEKIDTILWKNKLSPDTLHVDAGELVKEIEILEIILKKRDLDKKVIELIDKEIPYHIVFILLYQQSGQIWLSWKDDPHATTGKLKVDTYFHSPWMNCNDLALTIDGFNLDKIYENFIQQIADDKLIINEKSSVKEAVQTYKTNEKIQKQIQQLETQLKNENQFNRQVELNRKIKELKEIKLEEDTNNWI